MSEAVLDACATAIARLRGGDRSCTQDALLTFARQVAPFCAIYDRGAAAMVLGLAREFAGRLADGRMLYALDGAQRVCDADPARALAQAVRPLGARMATHRDPAALDGLLENACVAAAAALPAFDPAAPPESAQWQLCGAVLEMATYVARVELLRARAAIDAGPCDETPPTRQLAAHAPDWTAHLFCALIPAGYAAGYHYFAIAQPVPAPPGYNRVAHNVVYTPTTWPMLVDASELDPAYLQHGPWWAANYDAAGGDVQAVACSVLARAEPAVERVVRVNAHVAPIHWSFVSCMTRADAPDTLTLQFAGANAYICDENGVTGGARVAFIAEQWAERYLEPVV